jgi:ornithine cyclodeaminase/alanine dehydrogenase-like protein (mu-crystallin family)
VGDYSVLISGVLGVIGTGLGAAITAYAAKRFARTTGATVQTAEQIEAAKLLAEAKAEAKQLRDDAVVAAAKVIAAANDRAERTEIEQRQWHEEQVRTMQGEMARLRQQLEGGAQ